MKKRNIRFKTGYLLPKNNFWIGMGSVLNLAGSYFEYNYSNSGAEADLKALSSDWNNVGEDIRKAKRNFKKENKHKLCLKWFLVSKNRKVDNKPATNKAEKEISEELLEIEEDLVNYNPEVFKGIPQKKKMEILHSLSVVSIQHKSHSGPLPDADTLITYDSVIPNGADRIMKMAENQQSHRINLENKLVASQSSQSKVGQIFGFVIGLVGIGCGTFLAAIGATTVGGIIAGGTVVSLVSVFVIGKTIQRKSLEE